MIPFELRGSHRADQKAEMLRQLPPMILRYVAWNKLYLRSALWLASLLQVTVNGKTVKAVQGQRLRDAIAATGAKIEYGCEKVSDECYKTFVEDLLHVVIRNTVVNESLAALP